MTQTTAEMTAENIGKELLKLFVSHARALPDVWQKMSQLQQDETIDAVREGVKSAVESAVRIIAADNRMEVLGTLDSIAIKNGVRCTVQVSKASQNILGLYSAQGKDVLMVFTEPDFYTKGMRDVVGESDQRAIDLGHEYNPKGDGLEESDGHVNLDGSAEQATTETEQAEEADPELENAIELCRSTGRTSISFIQKSLGMGYNRAARLAETMEKLCVLTAPDASGVRKLTHWHHIA